MSSEEVVVPGPKGIVLKHMTETVQATYLFKPANLAPGGSYVVQFDVHVSSTRSPLPPPQGGEAVLLFLKGTPSGEYVLADPHMGSTHFNQLLPRGDGTAGIKLMHALASAVQHNGPRDQITALRLLQGFRGFTPQTWSVLQSAAHSQDPGVALGAIAALLRLDSAENVDLLKDFLDNSTADQNRIVLPSISIELGHIRTPSALPALEALSRSKDSAIKLGAVQALRGIKSPSSALALIERLDDPNADIRYFATMGLAETFNKGGDYAPPLGVFDQNPDKYVALWKDWWSQNRGAPPPPRESPFRGPVRQP